MLSSLAFDRAGRKLYFTTDDDDWRDLNVYDLQTRKATRLIHRKLPYGQPRLQPGRPFAVGRTPL